MWKKYERSRQETDRKKPLWLRSAAVGLAAALLLTGCGQSGDGGAQEGGSALTGQSRESNSDHGSEGAGGTQQIMGRYRESRVELPMELQDARDLWMDEEGLVLLSGDGRSYRSQDQGQSWQPVGEAPAELREAMEKGTIFYFRQNSLGETVGGYLEFPTDENGEPSYEDSFFQNVLYAADGSRIPLSQLPEQEFINCAACDEEGNFYLGSGSRIYRINGQDGSQEVLAELSSGCDYLTVCGKYLIIQGEQLQIFDLQTGKMGEQDTVLSEFLEPWLGASGDVGSRPYLLYQSRTEEGSLYILTEKGLHRHALYGSVMEQVVDGSMCSMSNPSLGYVSMLQSGESFLVLYSGGQLMQYTYDANASAVPENILRVWGLYEDTDIQSVLSAFSQKYPDLYISYEHPLSEDTGMTREDAMKVLSTELAAGNGPDVLLLDGLPYDTYVEKGVLADLSEVLERTGERYMEAVMDSYVRDGKQYAAPMEIRIPVLMGAADQLEGITGLEALADLLEQTRTSRPEGSLIGFYRAEEALRLLAPGSMGSWMTQAGGLDSEAVKEFLLQAKRIYEAQVSGLSVLEQERLDEISVYTVGEMRELAVQASFQLSNALYFDQPFALGMLESSGSIYGSYAVTAEMMRQMGIICIPMPGQAQDLADASQIWSVNAASKMQDLAMELVAYALSTQSWQENALGRATTNWEVLEEQIQEALLNEDEFGVMTSFIDIHGNEKMIDSGTPAKEDMDALRTLLENCQGVSQCDSRIYDAVIEEGQRALSGELTVEEAVKEIEKKVSLYLAE